MKMKTLAALALATLPLSFQATAEDWYPSAYGANDEIGAANLLTADVVKHAVSLVRTGKTYPLAVPVDKNLPAFRHRSFRLYNVQVGQQAGKSLGPNKFTFNDELVNAWTGVGTQLNGIGHIGIDNVYYNGNKAADFVTVAGVRKLGVEKVPPMVTRGVVLDMTTYYGKAIVPGGTEFTVADIQAVLKKQGLRLRKGDVVRVEAGELIPGDGEVIEGVASYGAGLAALVERSGHQVVEAGEPQQLLRDRRSARGERAGEPRLLDRRRGRARGRRVGRAVRGGPGCHGAPLAGRALAESLNDP